VTGCTDATCVVVESVKIGTLCVDALTVDGKPVCVTNDICHNAAYDLGAKSCVTSEIWGCCHTDSDCPNFAPAPANCYTSKCDAQAHLCSHTPIPGCCSCDADCPSRPCMNVECKCPQEGTALMALTKRGALEFVKRTTGAESDKQCSYTPIDNCCLRSRVPANDTDPFACNNMRVCADSETAICDKNMECQCIKQIEVQCTVDADCNPVSNATTTTRTPRPTEKHHSDSGDDDDTDSHVSTDESSDKWSEHSSDRTHRSGSTTATTTSRSGSRSHPIKSADRCAHFKCSRSRICVPDEADDLDADGDGTPCREDCDDNNPNVTTPVFCARTGTKSDPLRFNRDNDSCIDCGAPVDRFCAAACPAVVFNTTIPYIQVPEKSLCDTPRKRAVHQDDDDDDRERHVCFGCDCCAKNPGGCDIPATCAVDADGDGHQLCGTPVSACILAPNVTVDEDSDSSSRSSSSSSSSDSEDDDSTASSGTRSTHRHSRKSTSARTDDDDISDESSAASEAAEASAVQAALNQACVAWAESQNISNAVDFIELPANIDLVANCENCEKDPTRQELGNQICYLDTDGDRDVQCPYATTLEGCCNAITTSANANPLFIFEDVALQCCNSLILPAKTNCTFGKPPILINQCSCAKPYIPASKIEPESGSGTPDGCPNDPAGENRFNCFADKDGDGAPDCSKNITICSEKEDHAAACAADKSHGFDLVFVDLYGQSPKTAAKCDCDDTDCHVHSWVACLPDEDRDGFPSCKCELKCGKCDHDDIQIDPNPEKEKRKRTLSSAQKLLGGGGGGGKHHDSDSDTDSHSGSDDDDDDECQKIKDFEPQGKCPYQLAQALHYLHLQCDCCDKDKYAFPHSPWASKDPVNCPVDGITLLREHDYNCNNESNVFVGCDDKVTRDRNRVLRLTNSSETFGPINKTDSLWLGKCTASAQMCVHLAGFTPEAPEDRRRGFELAGKQPHQGEIGERDALECRGVKETRFHANASTTFDDVLDVGDCADFIVGCTFINGMCYPDVDDCVVIAQ
jgi:hypothetical protein